MIISDKVKELLKQVDICPACGGNWKEMEKSLAEGFDSDNCYLALLLIRNCPVCMGRFEDEYKWLKGGN